MGVDEEDEEEEDADWSQLAVSSTLSSKPIAPTSQTPTSSIEVDDSKRSPRFKRLWAAVGRDQWNTEAWTSIMSDLQTFPIEEARVYYEAFLTIYPTAVSLHLSHQIGILNVVFSRVFIGNSMQNMNIVSNSMKRQKPFYLVLLTVRV